MSSQGRRRSRRRAARNQSSDLAARVLAAIPAIIVAIVLVARGGIVFTLGISVLGLICLHELFTMFAFTSPSRLGGFAGFLAMTLSAHYGGIHDMVLALVCAIPVTFGLILLQPKGGAPGISVTVLGLTWIGLGFSHAVLLRDLPHGNAIVIDVLVGTFLGDTGAYLGGRAFGRTPMAPRISPNKTLEGLACGVLLGTVAVWFAGLYQDWLTGAQALLLGVLVALVGPIGDLFESYLKRDAGTKDTGRLFGAHGGALDRLDAVIFTIVVGYWVWRAML